MIVKVLMQFMRDKSKTVSEGKCVVLSTYIGNENGILTIYFSKLED